MHLFSPYLLNDSQTICLTIHFSKPLLCMTLIGGDWLIVLIFIMPVRTDKAALVSSFVYSLSGETAIFTAPSGKEWICIFIQSKAKRATSGRAMLMFHVSDLKLCRMFSFTSSCVTHCSKFNFQTFIIGALKKKSQLIDNFESTLKEWCGYKRFKCLVLRWNWCVFYYYIGHRHSTISLLCCV